jgi:hypothetical protein
MTVGGSHCPGVRKFAVPGLFMNRGADVYTYAEFLYKRIARESENFFHALCENALKSFIPVI